MSNFAIKNLNSDECQVEYKKYPYALVYEVSRKYFGKTDELDINWSECQDARFFSATEELHFFLNENEEGQGVVVSDVDGEPVIVTSYQLKEKCKEGQTIRVKKYLEYDEDGQVYVKLTRLCGIGEVK